MAPQDVRTRILEAAYACVARCGLAKTTVEAAAREAGLSRATVYRHFPGGKDELLAAVVDFEVVRFFVRLTEAVEGSTDLLDVTEASLSFAHRGLEEHVVLQQILRTEPQLLVPRITESTNRLHPFVRQFFEPYVAAEAAAGRLQDGVDPRFAADYVARMALSWANAAGGWDLDDRAQARQLVGLTLGGVVVGRDGRRGGSLDRETLQRYCLSVTLASSALLPPAVARAGQEERIIDAALVCIARWGLAKTGLEDVGREAGVSRATVYRAFPGGKEAVVEAVARTEVARFFAAVECLLAAATTLEDALVVGMTEAGTRIASHGALRAVVSFEPEEILPVLAFERMDQVLAVCSAFAAPHLARFLDGTTAVHVAEWTARVVVSYSSWPSVDVDITDETSVRRLVRQLFLPALASSGGPP